jgi:hypothetical protein
LTAPAEALGSACGGALDGALETGSAADAVSPVSCVKLFTAPVIGRRPENFSSFFGGAPGSLTLMRYKALGFVVWQGARWYVRRRYARLVPSRRVLAATAVVGMVGALAVAASQRNTDS